MLAHFTLNWVRVEHVRLFGEDPLLETALMDDAHCARAVAWVDQLFEWLSLVADAALHLI